MSKTTIDITFLRNMLPPEAVKAVEDVCPPAKRTKIDAEMLTKALDQLSPVSSDAKQIRKLLGTIARRDVRVRATGGSSDDSIGTDLSAFERSQLQTRTGRAAGVESTRPRDVSAVEKGAAAVRAEFTARPQVRDLPDLKKLEGPRSETDEWWAGLLLEGDLCSWGQQVIPGLERSVTRTSADGRFEVTFEQLLSTTKFNGYREQILTGSRQFVFISEPGSSDANLPRVVRLDGAYGTKVYRSYHRGFPTGRFSRDGNTLLLAHKWAAYDKSNHHTDSYSGLVVVRPESGAIVKELDEAREFVFSANGSMLISIVDRGASSGDRCPTSIEDRGPFPIGVTLHELDNNKEATIEVAGTPRPACQSVASADGRVIAVPFADGVQIVDFRGAPKASRRLSRLDNAVALALTSDGKTLAASDESGNVSFWDTETGAFLSTCCPAGPGAGYNVLGFAPDDLQLIAALHSYEKSETKYAYLLDFSESGHSMPARLPS